MRCLRQFPQFRFRQARSCRSGRDGGAVRRAAISVRRASRRASRRALFADQSARLCRCQLAGLSQRARRLPPQRLPASGVRVVVVGLRRQHQAAVFGARQRRSSDQPLCRDQEGQRADGAFLQPSLRLPATGLRFFTVYGPWGRPDMAMFIFAKAIIDGTADPAVQPRPDAAGFHLCRRRDRSGRAPDRSCRRQPIRCWSGGDARSGTSSAPWRIYNIGNNRTVEVCARGRAAGTGIRPQGDQGNGADAAGRRAGNLRRCRRSDARRRLSARQRRSSRVCTISRPGFAIITSADPAV